MPQVKQIQVGGSGTDGASGTGHVAFGNCSAAPVHGDGNVGHANPSDTTTGVIGIGGIYCGECPVPPRRATAWTEPARPASESGARVSPLPVCKVKVHRIGVLSGGATAAPENGRSVRRGPVFGVHGEGANGVHGVSSDATGSGVWGENSHAGYGVSGSTTSDFVQVRT